MFVGFLDTPDDNWSVQASGGHQRRIRTPRDAIDFGRMEAPLIFFGNNLRQSTRTNEHFILTLHIITYWTVLNIQKL